MSGISTLQEDCTHPTKPKGNKTMIHTSDTARKVRNLRTRTGLSISDLSTLSGVSRNTIKRLECMDNAFTSYSPKLQTVENVSRVFGIDVGTMLSTPASHILSKVKSW